MIGGSALIYHSCLAERLPIPKLTVFGLRIFQRVLLKSEHPVYLWLLAFDELKDTGKTVFGQQVKLYFYR